MNHAANASPLRGQHRFDRGPISRVYKIGTDFAYRANQSPDLKPRSGLAGETDDPRSCSLDPFRIRTQASNRAYHVFEAVGIQSRDQVDEAVLQAAFAETVHYVHNANRAAAC